jgi:hypothetical protein
MMKPIDDALVAVDRRTVQLRSIGLVEDALPQFVGLSHSRDQPLNPGEHLSPANRVAARQPPGAL